MNGEYTFARTVQRGYPTGLRIGSRHYGLSFTNGMIEGKRESP